MVIVDFILRGATALEEADHNLVDYLVASHFEYVFELSEILRVVIKLFNPKAYNSEL